MSEISAEISAKFRFSVEIDKISPLKFRFSDFSLYFFIFPEIFIFPMFFSFSGTLQPLSHSLHLLYIVQTFFIFSNYLFVHNSYHHLIIIFYFIFILHYKL